MRGDRAYRAGSWVALLNRMNKKDLTDMVVSEQRPKGGLRAGPEADL